MNPTENLLQSLVRISEGERKTGYTAANAIVGFTVNPANDTISFTGTIPVVIAADAGGKLIVTAQDAFTAAPVAV